MSEDVLHDEFSYADGSAAFSRGSVFVHADAERVLSLSDSRLVSESSVSDKRAAEKARDFLIGAGYENMKESGRRRSGNILYLLFDGECCGVPCTDCRAEVGVALDNCAVYSFRAPDKPPEGELKWPLDAASAQAALPSTLTALSSRRIVFDGKPCYEYSCLDGERRVTVTVDAEYGRELNVEVARG